MRVTKLLNILVSSLLAVVVFASLQTGAFAATTLSLSPASGTLGPTFSINVLIDSGTEELPGVALYVDYTGPVSYTSAEDGDISGCNYSESSGRISIACLPLSSFSGSKTVAKLNFSVTEDGEVSMAIPESGVDIGQPEHTLGGTTGGTYTVTTTGTGDDDDTGDDDTTTPTGTQLPSAGLITGGVTIVVLGVVLVALAVASYWIDHRVLLSVARESRDVIRTQGIKASISLINRARRAIWSEARQRRNQRQFEEKLVSEEFGD